jgi:hypothetical protein
VASGLHGPRGQAARRPRRRLFQLQGKSIRQTLSVDIRREAHCLALHPGGHLLLAASMDAITVVDLRQRSVVGGMRQPACGRAGARAAARPRLRLPPRPRGWRSHLLQP